jgi:TolA-binding protein
MAALDEKIEVPAVKTAVVQKPASRASAPQASDPKDVADHLLSTAKLYLDNKQYEIGRTKLKWIIEHFPGTPAAKEARKLLAESEGK